MSEIRTRLQLPGFRMEYQGARLFFTRVIEPLLDGVGHASVLRAEPPAAAAAHAGDGPRTAGSGGPGTPAASPSAQAQAEAAWSAAPGRSAAVPEGAEPPRPQAAAPGSSARGYRPPSSEFGPFVHRLGPEAAESDRQILAFAFFLWNYEKRDVISEDEVEGCFRALGLMPPSNAPDLYESLSSRQRFLLPGPKPLTWVLTTKGANYVKTRLLGSG